MLVDSNFFWQNSFTIAAVSVCLGGWVVTVGDLIACRTNLEILRAEFVCVLIGALH